MQMILAASPQSNLQEVDIGFDKRANPATFALTMLSSWLLHRAGYSGLYANVNYA